MHKPKGTVGNGVAPAAGAGRKNPVVAAAEKNEAVAAEKQRERMDAAGKLFRNANHRKWGTVLSDVNKGNIDERDARGRTLLMIAALQGEGEVVNRLAYMGADVNLEDDTGRSALRLALRNAHEGAAIVLQEWGADWKRDLRTLVVEGRALMVQKMKEALRLEDAEVEEATAGCIREGPGLRKSLELLSGEADALQELTVMFQPKLRESAEPSKAEGKPAGENEPKTPHVSFLGC